MFRGGCHGAGCIGRAASRFSAKSVVFRLLLESLSLFVSENDHRHACCTPRGEPDTAISLRTADGCSFTRHRGLRSTNSAAKLHR
ncbi:hypothetical protein NL676_036010 [Syzygium grande]|nr:hypothetical protein NL676_036010 [Syzygium grande]